MFPRRNLPLATDSQTLAENVLKKPHILNHVFEEHLEVLFSTYSGRRILITGAGGFIANHTLHEILKLNPHEIILVDCNENSLAEVLRSIRSSGATSQSIKITVYLADISSIQSERLVSEIGPVDLYLNFAAVKHVRSERNVVSAQRLITTNILAAVNFANLVQMNSSNCLQFTVSTDKAASPVNLMGASKLLMEKLLASTVLNFRTSRFANVAFSDGSLLSNWTNRVAKRQPLSLPKNTKRFFISPHDAGRLCALSMLGCKNHGTIPIIPTVNIMDFEEIVERFLGYYGFKPRFILERDLSSYISNNQIREIRRYYPVIIQPRDTIGEKPMEQFLDSSESASYWKEGIFQYAISPIEDPTSIISHLTESSQSSKISLTELRYLFTNYLPNFQHALTSNHLDDRI